MAEPNFVDTHIHCFDLTHPELVWDWLAPEAVHPNLGDIDAVKSRKYPLQAFLAESRRSGVTKAVHVQAAIGSPDPVAETAWLQEAAERTGFPLGIVGEADLKAPDVAAVLERHCAFDGMRGIRDFSDGDYLVEPAFRRGYAMLERFDLVCDLDCQPQDMHKARDLAKAQPGVTMVLDHAGFPQERSEEYFAFWQDGIRTLAEADSAVCKISGLGMKDPQWTVDSLRPWVLGCIEAFGVERSFFGTNWPVDRLYSSYADVVAAYRQIVADFSEAEQHALFVGNAERIYRI
jgi:predicted TIM-barrel fold metal-dependent hydrolase